MSELLSLDYLVKKIKYVTDIKKEGMSVSFQVNKDYCRILGDDKYELMPCFDQVDSIEKIAFLCASLNRPIEYLDVQLGESNTLINNLCDSTDGGEMNNFQMVNSNHTGINGSSVKYLPKLGILGTSIARVIDPQPREQTVANRTYRTLTSLGSVLVVNDEHKLYNYLDRGNIVVTCYNNDVSYMLVLNQLNLDTWYIASLFSIAPELVLSHAKNQVYIDYRDARMTLLKLEKALTDVLQAAYKAKKAAIYKDFESNAQNVLVSKFQRQEVEALVINNIKFEADKATYESIVVESVGLSNSVLPKLDTNGTFDIYTVLEVVVEGIKEKIFAVPLKDKGDGRSNAFSREEKFPLKVNGIPIVVSISDNHTRRAVNGFLINTDEVGLVVRRAACYQDPVLYNSFVKSVSKLSLEAHDVLANGLPVKVKVFNDSCYTKPEATLIHPRLYFIRDGKGRFNMYLNDTKTETVYIKRFVGLINAVKALNCRTNDHSLYSTSDGGRWVSRDQDWCRAQLKTIIEEFTTRKEGKPAVTVRDTTAAQRDTLIECMLRECTVAEKRSSELLASVVKSTGSEEAEFNKMKGFKVKGKLRNYFIEKSTNKVFNADSGSYICIVNGKGDMGVGYDSLVARMLALSNDSVMTNQITTLK